MINHISIKNYALIDSLELSAQSGFSTFTGETGAGKSILLGAIGLCIGKRADSSVIRQGSKKCIVELTLDVSEQKLQSYFTEKDIDYLEETIIRREISDNGRSRSFVNDCPVKLDTLNYLGDLLIDVHSQHDTLLLNSSEYQLKLVDDFAQNDKKKSEYYDSFQAYKSALKNQQEFLSNIDADLDYDYISFLAEELNDANLKVNECSALEDEIRILESSEEIQEKLSASHDLLIDEQTGVLNGLVNLQSNISIISSLDSAYQELLDRAKSCQIELDDIRQELEQKADEIDHSADQLEKAQDRYNQLQHLLSKHRVENEQELLDKLGILEKQLFDYNNRTAEIEKWQIKVDDLFNDANNKAIVLSESRKKVIPNIEKSICQLCKSLNFSHPVFKLEINPTPNLGIAGADDIQFLFSANAGHAPKPIAKAASGGELSRVMLALKSIMAKNSKLPTIIFDEIDTGVSGKTATKVAAILKEMGNTMQVWAITHLPQIAASGEFHFKVEKQTKKGVTTTGIIPLNKEQRIASVAEMLSSGNPTKAAIENAKELISVS